MAKKYWLKFGTGLPSSYTGLAPSFIHFIKADGTTVAGPGITEIIAGTGAYQFTWNPTFPIFFVVDGGATLTDASVRYLTGSLDPLQAIDESVVNLGSTLLAFGSTLGAVGTILTNQGSTLVGMGNTLGAIGVSQLAIGATIIAQGATIVGMGNTLGAIGSSQLAIGATVVYDSVQLQLALSTLLALGSSQIAEGATLIAIGNTISSLGAVSLGVTLNYVSSQISALALAVGSTSSSFGSTSTDPVDIYGYVKRIQENLEGNSSFNKATGAWQITSRGSSIILANKTLTNTAATATKT